MRLLLPLLLLFSTLLAGCAGGLRINTDHTAKDQDSRVQYIVLHYTASDSQRSLAMLTHGGVSAHYMIDQEGTIYRLVDENRRAWHAGESEWEGRTWLNATSIGIEMVNLGFRDTPTGRQWYPFTEEQIKALIPLLKDIQQRHRLGPNAVIGHSDIAPSRKQDPGPMFPWARLAAAGIINWPTPATVAQRGWVRERRRRLLLPNPYQPRMTRRMTKTTWMTSRLRALPTCRWLRSPLSLSKSYCP